MESSSAGSGRVDLHRPCPQVWGLPSLLQLRHRRWKIGRQFWYEVVPPAG